MMETKQKLNINPLELAIIVRNMTGLPKPKLERILEEGDRRFTDLAGEVKDLVLDLCYSESFCCNAGLDYSNPNSRLIKTAIARYLLCQELN